MNEQLKQEILVLIRSWYGEARDERMARIDKEIHDHRRDATAHSGGGHEHTAEVKLT